MDTIGKIAIGFVLCAAVMAVYANEKSTSGYLTIGTPDNLRQVQPVRHDTDRISSLIERADARPSPQGMNQQQAEAAYRSSHAGCSTFDISCHLGL